MQFVKLTIVSVILMVTTCLLVEIDQTLKAASHSPILNLTVYWELKRSHWSNDSLSQDRGQ